MKFFRVSPRLKKPPVLDEAFRPLSLENRAFLKAVLESTLAAPVTIAVEREKGQIAVYKTRVFASGMEECNCQYIERLLKTILWLKGGARIIFSGPDSIYHFLKKAYAPGGIRAFDAEFMSRVYEREFTVEQVDAARIPAPFERAEPVGGSLDGCRIGFDAGGSDRKVAALVNGEVVYSEEVIWHPKTQSDPDYHYQEIKTAILKAAQYLPRVDAIGVSSAGIYVNNRTMVASLFLKVPSGLFDQKIKDIYLNIAHELGDVPIEVRNDGDVTALAGAMSLHDTNILGIAMGTSQAAGYIDGAGNITGCLNELAFVPVDNNESAAIDEWSGDRGCGVKYFSQDAVIRLAPAAGIQLRGEDTPAEKLKMVQELIKAGDERAGKIFETIGCYLGYSLAYYAEFYDLKRVLILGRVTSQAGGNIILENAQAVLELEFPELAQRIQLHLPEESDRRVGQAIAAASLPKLMNLEKRSVNHVVE